MTQEDRRPRRRGRPRADQSPVTDDEILRAALHSSATHGYEGTSVRDRNTRLGSATT